MTALTRPSASFLAPRAVVSTASRVRLRARASAAAASTSAAPGYLAAAVREDAAGLGDAHELSLLISALGDACKEIGAALEAAPLLGVSGYAGGCNASGDAQKKLDVLADEIMRARLAETGLVRCLASEENDGVVAVTEGAPFVVVFDPLDGSRNVDVSIPVGTIAGVYRAEAGKPLEEQPLRPGRELVCALYVNYSVQTTLCLAPPGAERVDFWTLDRSPGRAWVRTAEDVQCPVRGAIYSLNTARAFDWSEGLRQYIDDVSQGKGQSGKQASLRYVCSLVSDFHRTLLQGGWCGNPRAHLRIVFECAPLAFIAERAGGLATDGTAGGRVLDRLPLHLHDRMELFMGSSEDIQELATYPDVRQPGDKAYSV